jgi:hypothetical protein
MHDFIQSLAFNSGRALLLARSAPSGWIQRGIMRSFGEDDVVAPYLSRPRPAGQGLRKAKTRKRR